MKWKRMLPHIALKFGHGIPKLPPTCLPNLSGKSSLLTATNKIPFSKENPCCHDIGTQDCVCVFWESSCHIINHSCLMPCLNFRWRWSLQDLPGTAWHSHHWTASSQFSQSCFGGSQCSNGPSAQTCNNVQRVATCTDCQKPWVLYAARKVPLKDLQNLAKLLDVRCCPAVTGDWWWQHSHRQWPVVTHIWSC